MNSKDRLYVGLFYTEIWYKIKVLLYKFYLKNEI